VLTADRPPELRHSGANQTIDQVKMFGDYALWFVDAALPEANPPAVAIRNLRILAARAYANANGIRKGVVHINLPFRAPLEPTPVETDFKEVSAGAEAREESKPYTQFPKHNRTRLNKDTLSEIGEILNRYVNVIVCGPRSPGGEFAKSMFHLADAASAVIFPDAVSGVRFHGQQVLGDSLVISSYDTLLAYREMNEPNVVIRFGDVPTSKTLNSYLEKLNPQYRFHITSDGVWADDSHRQTMMLQTDPVSFCEDIYDEIWDKVAWTPWAVNLKQIIDPEVWHLIEQGIATGSYFDGAAVYDVVDLLPPESTLFAGNSLAVRHLDQFGKPSNKRIFAYANRGASGIDGNISTALGAGASRPDKPLVAIVGDITFYHDMNGLLAVHRCGVPVTIVLLNNNGGGIFHRLPIKDYDPEFTDLWITPHGLDFSHAAKLYGLEYVQVTEREAFRQAFSASVNNRTSAIIEVRTDAKQDLARRSAIMKAVQEKLRAL
jgi:2-succinyl-5-enolpyruvyl-6-hydroxy-3-cyclohexene-1-carboxylate synthase